MKIRVDRPINGLFPDCQPEIGKVYEARPGAPMGGEKKKGFVIIDLPRKKNIVLREGEFVIVEQGAEKRTGTAWDQKKALELLGQGMTMKQVAEELGVKPKQVENLKYREKKKEKDAEMRKKIEELEKRQAAADAEPERQQEAAPGTEECSVRPGPKDEISCSELTVMLCEARAQLAEERESAEIRREQIERLSDELKRAQGENWRLQKAIIALVTEKYT